MQSPDKPDFFTTFHQLCGKLLNHQERSTLHNCLQTYQASHDVLAFVSHTLFLWSTHQRLQLLPFVRQMIEMEDRAKFDTLLGVHQGYVVRGPRSNKSSSLSSTRSGTNPGQRAEMHVIKIRPGASPRMGFSIRGGSEFGLSIYVSLVEPSSPAETAGLRPGDQIVESNGVDLKRVESQRAVDLLNSTPKQTLVIRRTKKIPEWKVTKERLLWFDVATRKLVATPSGELSSTQQAGSEPTVVKERKVVLRLKHDTDFVGLNVRGGKEFGVGIYVSRVDKGGQAERSGVEVGDQVIQVNDHRLESIPHGTAVSLLRDSRHIVLTLWAVGRFPAYKELFSEYVWSGCDDKTANGAPRTHIAELHPEPRPVHARKTGRVVQRTRTRESRVDRAQRDSGIGLHHPPPDYDDSDDDDDDNEADAGRPVKSELFYPRDQDIIFRGNYGDNWRKAYSTDDAASTATAASERRLAPAYLRKSFAGLASDSDSSDADMDYTTFLERKSRRDEDKKRGAAAGTASSRPRSAGSPGSGAGAGDTASGRSSPLPVKAKRSPGARSEPVLLNSAHYAKRSASAQSERGAGSAAPVLVDSAPPPPPHAKRSEKGARGAGSEPVLVNSTHYAEPALVRATDRAERREMLTRSEAVPEVERHAGTDLTDYNTAGLVIYGGDKREEPGEEGGRRRGPSPDGDYETYAVVRKPPKRPDRSPAQTTRAALSKTTSTTSNNTYNPTSNSSGSGSSSEQSSEQSGEPGASRTHGHRHRTHVYHIHTSPDTPRRAPRDKKKRLAKSDRKDSVVEETGDLQVDDNDDRYVVVTEVMTEVATPREVTPPRDYRQPDRPRRWSQNSEGSSTSHSGSTTVNEPPPRAVSGVPGGPAASPTASDLLSQEIQRLESRQSSIGSREILQLGDSPSAKTPSSSSDRDPVKADSGGKKGGTWSAFKKKLTGSVRGKKGKVREPIQIYDEKREPSGTKEAEAVPFSMGSLRKKGVFERSFGSQMMNQQTVDKYNLMMVEERARYLLSRDENDAVLRHIKTYHDSKELSRLVSNLMAILDTSDKLKLLKDIRGVVYPQDVAQFDDLVAQHELEAFHETSSRLHLPLNPVHKSDSRTKPRNKLITTVVDAEGHFHIQSLDQQAKDTSHQQQQRQNGDGVGVNPPQPTKPQAPASITLLQHATNHKSVNNASRASTTTNNAYVNKNNNNNNIVINNRNRTAEPRSPANQEVPITPPLGWRDDREIILVEKEPVPPPTPPPPPEEGFVVYVSKQKKNLGLIVCGGAGDHRDRSVRIEMVMPWGACADDEQIKSGLHILSVDDQSVEGMTQSEAIALLKRCFVNKKSVNMKLRLKEP